MWVELTDTSGVRISLNLQLAKVIRPTPSGGTLIDYAPEQHDAGYFHVTEPYATVLAKLRGEPLLDGAQFEERCRLHMHQCWQLPYNLATRLVICEDKLAAANTRIAELTAAKGGAS